MVIIGAKGLAKELLTVLSWNKSITNDIYLFDDISSDIPEIVFDRFPVIRSWDKLENIFNTISKDFVLGVGGVDARMYLASKACSIGGKLSSLISRHALIGEFGVNLSVGVCILSNAIITVDIQIGEGSLINKAVSISHDVVVGKYCEISPGARILGRASIGDLTEIGANAVILPNIRIGTRCKVGAGAVVTKDVDDGLTVVGIPARPIKYT